jgi:hypothetical protein
MGQAVAAALRRSRGRRIFVRKFFGRRVSEKSSYEDFSACGRRVTGLAAGGRGA